MATLGEHHAQNSRQEMKDRIQGEAEGMQLIRNPYSPAQWEKVQAIENIIETARQQAGFEDDRGGE